MLTPRPAHTTYTSIPSSTILRSVLTPIPPSAPYLTPPTKDPPNPTGTPPPPHQGNRPHHPKDRTVAITAHNNPRWPARPWVDAVPVCAKEAGLSRVVGGGTAPVRVALPGPKPRESEGHPGADSTPSTTPCYPQTPSKKATLAVKPDNIARAGRPPTTLITAPTPPPPRLRPQMSVLPGHPKPPPATPPVKPPVRWRFRPAPDTRQPDGDGPW